MRPVIIYNLLKKDAFLGTCVGFFFSSHALRTVIHIDFHSILAATIVLLIIVNSLVSFPTIIKKDVSWLHGLSLMALVVFIIFQIPLSGNFAKGIEILLILTLLLLPANIEKQEVFLSCIKKICILSVLLQSIVLLINKSHIYSFGLNYLLIGALTPVVSAYLYHKSWTTKNRVQRILYLIGAMLTLLALLQVQGRFSLLVCLSGILLLTGFHARKILTTFEGLFLISVLTYFSYAVLEILQSAPALVRTLLLFQSGETLDRFIILEIYFTELIGNWVTGFGLGATPIFPPYYYPHNYIVEFITEFGIVGGQFIVVLTLGVILRLKRMTLRNDDHAFAVFLGINYILFFLKSGSIYDSFTLFLTFSVITVIRAPKGMKYYAV